ncbi:hypothetical protein B0A55_03741 [Friedmanniomyces simplex]|uniref:Uncharacterized protein n=1 Tax=Friedmanniomyces simplex TaxID=329884 RepID=A0A4U0XJ39_9PEZI|nr:hypothetical protein B0A55_03741 [Friedmanniomyces simplex]
MTSQYFGNQTEDQVNYLLSLTWDGPAPTTSHYDLSLEDMAGLAPSAIGLSQHQHGLYPAPFTVYCNPNIAILLPFGIAPSNQQNDRFTIETPSTPANGGVNWDLISPELRAYLIQRGVISDYPTRFLGVNRAPASNHPVFMPQGPAHPAPQQMVMAPSNTPPAAQPVPHLAYQLNHPQPNPAHLAPQQMVMAPSNAPPAAQPVPPSAYQLNQRQPDPARFASQHPGPHRLASPPPPAQNLIAASTTLTNNGAQLVGKVPHEAQPPPMGEDVSMEEVMKFAPNWLRCPEVAVRAIRNGQDSSDLVAMFFAPNGPPTVGDEKTAAARVRQQLSQGARLAVRPGVNMSFDKQHRFDTQKAIRDLGPQPDLTANMWELRAAYDVNSSRTTNFAHVKLAAFYASMPINDFPTGGAEKVLTKCLRFAWNNPQLDLDTSHFDWIIQTQGF